MTEKFLQQIIESITLYREGALYNGSNSLTKHIYRSGLSLSGSGVGMTIAIAKITGHLTVEEAKKAEEIRLASIAEIDKS